MAFTENSKGTDPQGNSMPVPISGPPPSGITNVTLSANASYTTGWFKARGYISLYYLMFSNVTGSIKFEYSEDSNGSTIIGSPVMVQFDSEFANIAPRVGAFAPRASYIRVTYTNGSTNQSVFNLIILLLTSNAQPSLETLKDALADTRLALVTKTALQARDGSGAWGFINQTGNALNVNVANPGAATDVSTLAKDLTLTNGSANIKIVNGNNVAYGTQAAPFNVALPTTQNTNLSNIDTDLGAPGDTAVTDSTLSASVIALLKGSLFRLSNPLAVTSAPLANTPKYYNYGTTPVAGTATGTGVVTLKSGSGALTSIFCVNQTSNDVYLCVWDVASSTTVTPGTTVPTFVYCIDATVPLSLTAIHNLANGCKFGIYTSPSGNTVVTSAQITFTYR